MINTSELRPGNLVRWNPGLSNPSSTLSPLIVEVAAIKAGSIGYVPANIAHRVEPFGDDLLQQEPVFRDATEFEAIPFSPILEQTLSKQLEKKEEHTYPGFDKVTSLHQYQNIFFTHTGEELDTSDLHHILHEL